VGPVKSVYRIVPIQPRIAHQLEHQLLGCLIGNPRSLDPGLSVAVYFLLVILNPMVNESHDPGLAVAIYFVLFDFDKSF
jgi:hypothetical protein